MSSLPIIEVFLRADPLESVVVSDPPVEVNQPIFQLINPSNFATAAQGELAESAIQPDVLALALEGKEDADPTILKAADIGDSVQPYDADTVIDSEYPAVKSKAESALQPAALNNYETATQLNARDTANRDRGNHTGTQAIATINGLETALAGKASAAQGAKADTALQPGNNISLLTNNVGFITENIPDGAKINGVAHFCRASNPIQRIDGSPLQIDDKCYRTDLNVDTFWNGTYWLGATQYMATTSPLLAVATANLNSTSLALNSYPIFAEKVDYALFLFDSNRNNASNYWTFKFDVALFTHAAVGTSVGQVTTIGLNTLTNYRLSLVANTYLNPANSDNVLPKWWWNLSATGSLYSRISACATLYYRQVYL